MSDVEVRFKKGKTVVAVIPSRFGLGGERYSAAVDTALFTWKFYTEKKPKKLGTNTPWSPKAWDRAEVHDKWISREKYEIGLGEGKLL